MKDLAPVMIPTLCRYEHFKRCIESLSKCTWAEDTVVYIGLDYPANESHYLGYEKIKNYLESEAERLGFKQIFVIKRPYNFGIGEKGNYAQLRDQIFKQYDRFIFSEDDNEFGKNFLVYMNKALDLFKEDKRMFSVCGYFHGEELANFKHEYYFDYASCAWGEGFWRDKYYQYLDWKSKNAPMDILWSKKIFKILKVDQSLILPLMIMNRKNVIWGDFYMSTYCLINNMYNICPTISKIRNYGYDGSGVTCKKVDSALPSIDIDCRIDICIDNPEKVFLDSLSLRTIFRRYRKASFLRIKFVGNLIIFLLMSIVAAINSCRKRI